MLGAPPDDGPAEGHIHRPGSPEPPRGLQTHGGRGGADTGGAKGGPHSHTQGHPGGRAFQGVFSSPLECQNLKSRPSGRVWGQPAPKRTYIKSSKFFPGGPEAFGRSNSNSRLFKPDYGVNPPPNKQTSNRPSFSGGSWALRNGKTRTHGLLSSISGGGSSPSDHQIVQVFGGHPPPTWIGFSSPIGALTRPSFLGATAPNLDRARPGPLPRKSAET